LYGEESKKKGKESGLVINPGGRNVCSAGGSREEKKNIMGVRSRQTSALGETEKT